MKQAKNLKKVLAGMKKANNDIQKYIAELDKKILKADQQYLKLLLNDDKKKLKTAKALIGAK